MNQDIDSMHVADIASYIIKHRNAEELEQFLEGLAQSLASNAVSMEEENGETPQSDILHQTAICIFDAQQTWAARPGN